VAGLTLPRRHSHCLIQGQHRKTARPGGRKGLSARLQSPIPGSQRSSRHTGGGGAAGLEYGGEGEELHGLGRGDLRQRGVCVEIEVMRVGEAKKCRMPF
jgi:hypothetical protein